MLYSRQLRLAEIVGKRSCFLFGPRQTGKSTMLRTQLPAAPTWNLLRSADYAALSADPALLRRQLEAMRPRPEFVVIDEVQRIPELLNEVHLMIEELGVRFVLTGSSARSLRRRGVNLLGGRARTLVLHPFTSQELGGDFDLLRALNRGLLPPIYLSETPDADLADYVGTYLREEVAAEGFARSIPAFARFLETAALSNGRQINFTKMASDAQVKRTTVVDWFDVLRDTLLAIELPAWRGSRKRKAVATAKLYLFDLGVARHLTNTGAVRARSRQFGEAFEHFLFHELESARAYGLYEALHYWRSTAQHEVDFILDESIAIEVKAAATIGPYELRGLQALAEESAMRRLLVVALVDRPQRYGDIDILPYQEFLARLWQRTL
jgi:uncharacterized protein